MDSVILLVCLIVLFGVNVCKYVFVFLSKCLGLLEILLKIFGSLIIDVGLFVMIIFNDVCVLVK